VYRDENAHTGRSLFSFDRTSLRIALLCHCRTDKLFNDSCRRRKNDVMKTQRCAISSAIAGGTECVNWQRAKIRSVSQHLERRNATDATCYVACYYYSVQFLRSLCAIQYRGRISWETFKFIINVNYLSSLIKMRTIFLNLGRNLASPSWNDIITNELSAITPQFDITTT